MLDSMQKLYPVNTTVAAGSRWKYGVVCERVSCP